MRLACFMAVATAGWVLPGFHAMAQAVPCDINPHQPECIEAEPKLETEPKFIIEIRPAIKIVKPRTLPTPKTKPAVKPKPAVVAKPVEKRRPLAHKIPSAGAIKPLAPPAPSWLGLPQTDLPVLAGSDFDDIPGQFIIELDRAALQAQGIDLATISIADLASLLGLAPTQIRSVQRVFMGTAVLRASPDQAQSLSRNPLVLKVHADTKIRAMGGADRKVPPLSWGLDRLDVPVLPLDGKFDREGGDYAARLYVFDTGIDANQAEFGGRVKWGKRFALPVPDTSGRCRDHGTEMASLAAGANTGSAPKAEIIDVVVLPCSRDAPGEGSSLIEAAEWVLLRERTLKDAKPVVVNMSLAGKWSEIINRAVAVLTQNHVAVVAAAGNNGQDACGFSPASAADALTVGATNAKDGIVSTSNFGRCVDVHAPGDLVTAVSEGADAPYVAVRGTSGATALVSGLLARSIRKKGPQAAALWIEESGVPQDMWLKSAPKGKPVRVALAQMNAQWRKVCRIEADGTDLRARPASSAQPVARLNAGAKVTVENADNGWVRVQVDGKRGWLPVANRDRKSLLSLVGNGPCEAAP